MYVDPRDANSPRERWLTQHILCNTGQGGFSVAEGEWDGEPVLGLRWNGSDDPDVAGNPQSHGRPTWFVVPDELADAMRKSARQLSERTDQIEVRITKPKEFDAGVYCVRMKLRSDLAAEWGAEGPTFVMPVLPNRIVRGEDGYRAAAVDPATGLVGKFVRGEWEGTMYTNGLREGDNETTVGAVCHALVAAVTRSLKRGRA
jgi:hypothetical protein